MPATNPGEKPTECLEARDVVPRHEPVDRWQRLAHAAAQRLVQRAALERVDPHDGVRRAVQAPPLATDEPGVLPFPAVGDDEDNCAAREGPAAPDVVELLQRRADA